MGVEAPSWVARHDLRHLDRRGDTPRRSDVQRAPQRSDRGGTHRRVRLNRARVVGAIVYVTCSESCAGRERQLADRLASPGAGWLPAMGLTPRKCTCGGASAWSVEDMALTGPSGPPRMISVQVACRRSGRCVMIGRRATRGAHSDRPVFRSGGLTLRTPSRPGSTWSPPSRWTRSRPAPISATTRKSPSGRRTSAGSTPGDVLADLKLEHVDLVAGCPPCQGFSSVRTRNLRTAVDDPRNELIADYVRFSVRDLAPRAILLKNVPALRHDRLWVNASDELEALGYPAREGMRILNAADYGVPQNRRRLVMVALRGAPVPRAKAQSGPAYRPPGVQRPARPCGRSGDPLHDVPERRTDRVMQIPSARCPTTAAGVWIAGRALLGVPHGFRWFQGRLRAYALGQAQSDHHRWLPQSFQGPVSASG